MLPLKVSAPLPDWVRLPVPLITPLRATASERLTTRAALLSTLPAMLPLAPPAPNCKLPALMVVPPV